MAKKIGDLLIGLIILLFLVGGFSSFLFRADEVTKINSNIVGKLEGFEGNLSDVRTLEETFTTKMDEQQEFGAEPDTDDSDVGKDAGGIANLFSKNILVRFFSSVGKSIPEFKKPIALILSIMAITITILLIRLVLGETKV